MSFADAFAVVKPAYEIPDDDLVGEVLVPAFRECDEVRLAAGFFTSRCLAQIAPGLAAFLNDSDFAMDLMVSPEISDEDRKAIERGVREPETVVQEALEKLFEKAAISESAIERHCIQTLSFLVASGRLRMRIVLMERGMYHKKIWLFRSEGDWLAVHGSGNATERGLLVNGEQMSIDRAWMDGNQSEARVQLFLDQWDRQWENRHPSSVTLEAAQALDLLRRYAGAEPPTASDFWEAWRLDNEAGLEPELPPGFRVAPISHRLAVPPDLTWREGRYGHQGMAVDALLDSGGGILAIATGGGKTKTALIAATQLQDRAPKHSCVAILVPTKPLVRQWTGDVREFGVDPAVLSGSTPSVRRSELERISHAFMSEQPRTEVLIISNSLFGSADSPERQWLAALPESVTRVLIADEVHNLGTPSFINDPPEFFEHRIGLSATPIRQYDPDGTDQLFTYFGGPPLFEFTLEDAINSGCLTPYHYHLHVIEFDQDEMDHYSFLTDELVRAGFRIDDDGRTLIPNAKVERLLRERRALVEQADAKLPALEAELKRMGTDSIARTLIYTSAKPTVLDKPKQITSVNGILERNNIISHQYTSRETGTARSRKILDRFGSGDYQVLTAMKVLDEGVDLPETDTAFLMASSTVQREWVQRRGRILRFAEGKQRAHLHDFIVVPPDPESPSAQSLLRSELRRAQEFANVAENEFDPDGPNSVIRTLEAMAWSGSDG